MTLLPCPFCDGPPKEMSTGASEIAGQCIQTCWIECADCGAQGPQVEIIDHEPPYQFVRNKWNGYKKQEAVSIGKRLAPLPADLATMAKAPWET